MTITRFAPSPTGLLHIGNVRTALICYLYAKSKGGKFMLRLDDTDKERSREEYVDVIKDSLSWLGLEWDLFARQSDRFNRYDEVKAQLIAAGRLYPCYETAEELDMKRKMQMGRGQPPIYDRAALKLSDKEKSEFESKGMRPHWRFKLDHDEEIAWDDLIKGPTRFEAKHLSDPILIRESGSYTYMLPSTIDDVDFNITNVIRGEDHVSNTAIQLQLFTAISDGKKPEFAHHSLMKSKDGKISKRKGGFDVASLREEGIEPLAIISYLARLGTSLPVELRESIDELIANFNIKHFSKAAATYDFDELKRLSNKVIHLMSFEEAKDKLSALSLSEVDEDFWDSVKANINSLSEIKQWWSICKEELKPEVEDRDFLLEACDLLPQGEWNEGTWNEWIGKLKEKTGRGGKQLFMPLRKALTARENGPELKYLLPLIGREKVQMRLKGNTA